MSLKLSSLSKELQAKILTEVGGLSSLSNLVVTSASKEVLVKKMDELREKIREIDAIAKTVRTITSGIKSVEELPEDILSKVGALGKKVGVDEDEFNDAKEKVREQITALESSVFALDELFSDERSNLESQISDLEYDLDELEEGEQNS